MPNNLNTEANRSNANVMMNSVDHETKLFPVETKKTAKDEPPTHWNVHSDLVKAAECVAEQWNSQVDKLFNGRSDTQIEVVSSIYAVCWVFRDNDQVLKSYLKEHGARTNGNVKNWVQPIVKSFLIKLHESCKSQVTKIAGAIRLGIDNDISPGDYSKFLSDNGGYCKAYQKHVGARTNNGDDETLERIDRLELINGFIENPDAPEHDAPHELRGCTGRQLVIIEMTEPGSQYRILRRIDLDERRLNQLIERHAFKSVGSNSNKGAK